MTSSSLFLHSLARSRTAYVCALQILATPTATMSDTPADGGKKNIRLSAAIARTVPNASSDEGKKTVARLLARITGTTPTAAAETTKTTKATTKRSHKAKAGAKRKAQDEEPARPAPAPAAAADSDVAMAPAQAATATAAATVTAVPNGNGSAAGPDAGAAPVVAVGVSDQLAYEEFVKLNPTAYGEGDLVVFRHGKQFLHRPASDKVSLAQALEGIEGPCHCVRHSATPKKQMLDGADATAKNTPTYPTVVVSGKWQRVDGTLLDCMFARNTFGQWHVQPSCWPGDAFNVMTAYLQSGWVDVHVMAIGSSHIGWSGTFEIRAGKATYDEFAIEMKKRAYLVTINAGYASGTFRLANEQKFPDPVQLTRMTMEHAISNTMRYATRPSGGFLPGDTRESILADERAYHDRKSELASATRKQEGDEEEEAMRPAKRTALEFHVCRTGGGRCLTIRLTSGQTIWDLKNAIERDIKIPAADQYILIKNNGRHDKEVPVEDLLEIAGNKLGLVVASRTAPPMFLPATITQGSILLVKDNRGVYCRAVVLDVAKQSQSILIRFTEWHSHYNRWISIHNDIIASEPPADTTEIDAGAGAWRAVEAAHGVCHKTANNTASAAANLPDQNSSDTEAAGDTEAAAFKAMEFLARVMGH